MPRHNTNIALQQEISVCHQDASTTQLCDGSLLSQQWLLCKPDLYSRCKRDLRIVPPGDLTDGRLQIGASRHVATCCPAASEVGNMLRKPVPACPYTDLTRKFVDDCRPTRSCACSKRSRRLK